MPQGFTYGVGTQSPAEAASILQNALKNRFDPLELAKYRDQRMGELTDRIAGDVGAGDVRDARKAGIFAGDLQHDMDTDPSTGQVPRDRTKAVEDALSESALTMRPEVEDATNAVAKRNAFAKFLDANAGFKAQISPEGEQALNEASRRRQMETAASYGANPAKNKLTADGQKSVTALHQAVDLGTKLHAILTNPKSGLDAAPPTDLMGQIVNAGTGKLKRFAYSQGILQDEPGSESPGYDEATQLAEMMKVMASKGLASASRNMQWIKQIQDHLTQGQLPPAANLKRLELFLSQAPDLEKDIYDSELGHVRLDPYTAPAKPAASTPAGVVGSFLAPKRAPMAPAAPAAQSPADLLYQRHLGGGQ